MAKTMAFVKDGVVTNLLWCSDSAPDRNDLISIGDRSVGIGDEYRDGGFFRDGETILTPLESENETLKRELAEMDAALLDIEYENILGGL